MNNPWFWTVVLLVTLTMFELATARKYSTIADTFHHNTRVGGGW